MGADYINFKRRIRKIGPVIDLGCKKACPPDHIGVDAVDYGQDVLWDVRTGLPFPDNSVRHIRCAHFIEHLGYDECAVVIPEMLRICRIGANISLSCPHSDSKEAHYHNHVSFWNEHRMRGITAGFYGLAPKGGKYMSIVGMEHVGMEFRVQIEIKAK